jgi:hypothetical protein
MTPKDGNEGQQAGPEAPQVEQATIQVPAVEAPKPPPFETVVRGERPPEQD